MGSKSSKYTWENLNVGDLVSCSSATLLFNNEKHPYLKMQFEESKDLIGTVSCLNLSDAAYAQTLTLKALKLKYKKLFSSKTIKARILSIDPKKKYLELTIKPVFMDTTSPCLMSRELVELGVAYYGFVSKVVD